MINTFKKTPHVTTSKFLLIALIAMSSLTVSGQSKVKKEKAEKPYTVIEKSPYMNRVQIRKNTKGTENIVQIEALNVSGGSIVMGAQNPVLPAAEITDISAIVGSYNLTRQISKSGRGEILQLLDVVYPFRARVTISDQILEFELKEPGFWRVSVGIAQ